MQSCATVAMGSRAVNGRTCDRELLTQNACVGCPSSIYWCLYVRTVVFLVTTFNLHLIEGISPQAAMPNILAPKRYVHRCALTPAFLHRMHSAPSFKCLLRVCSVSMVHACDGVQCEHVLLASQPGAIARRMRDGGSADC